MRVPDGIRFVGWLRDAAQAWWEQAPRFYRRPNWNQYYLGIAEVVAARGDCTRSRVGCVLVREDNTVASIGYNGVAPGETGCLAGACPRGRFSLDELPPYAPYHQGETICIARHAEWNAIANMRPGDKPITAYITREPCEWCRRHLKANSINHIVWPGHEEWL